MSAFWLASLTVMSDVQFVIRSCFFIPIDCENIKARDCREIKDDGFTMSGVYKVTPVGTFKGLKVYCDMDTDGGGWMVGRTGVH